MRNSRSVVLVLALALSGVSALACLQYRRAVSYREGIQRANEANEHLNRELASARSQLDRGSEEQRTLAEALQQVEDLLRLSAASEAERLIGEVELLWPPDQRRVEALDAWVGTARELIALRPEFLRCKDRLEIAGGLGEERSLVAELDRILQQEQRSDVDRQRLGELRRKLRALRDERGGAGPRFDSPADAWWYQGVQDALRSLDQLSALLDTDGEEHGWSVGRRASVARQLVASTDQAAWAEAIASIGDRDESPLYDGLVIERQAGLRPVRHAETSLWEFEAVLADEEGTGTVVVMVLVPGGAIEVEGTTVELEPFFISKYKLGFDQVEFLARASQAVGVTSRAGDSSSLMFAGAAGWDESFTMLWRFGWEVPTEHQWLHAARAGGDLISGISPVDDEAMAQAIQEGAANRWGLVGMQEGAVEWAINQESRELVGRGDWNATRWALAVQYPDEGWSGEYSDSWLALRPTRKLE